MVSGSAPPDGQPRGAASGLIRHRWLTAAGTTATVAAMAGGGLLLLRQPPAAGPHRDCGLVPCSATLPRSVTASATGPAASPGPARPAAHPARSPGRSGRPAQVRVHYRIRHLPGGTVTGQLVIANHGGAPVTGWPGWPGGWRGPQQHGSGGWPAPGPGGWPGAGQGGWPGGR